MRKACHSGTKLAQPPIKCRLFRDKRLVNVPLELLLADFGHSQDSNRVNSHRRSILYIVLYSTALRMPEIECKYNKQIQCMYSFLFVDNTSRYYSPYQPPSRFYRTVLHGIDRRSYHTVIQYPSAYSNSHNTQIDRKIETNSFFLPTSPQVLKSRSDRTVFKTPRVNCAFD